MKLFTALTSALAFTTAIAAPFAVNGTETNSLEQRASPLQNTGITVFHSKQGLMSTGRWTCRFRMMGFLQATGAMYDVLKEKMDVSSSTETPVERASVISQAFFANLRPWLASQFPDNRAHLAKSLFNVGSSVDAGWEGTIGAEFQITADEALYNKIIDALKGYLTGRGSDTVEVVFQSVEDAFTIGNPAAYKLPMLKARSANTCSTTTSIVSLFQNRVPEIPSYSGPEC